MSDPSAPSRVTKSHIALYNRRLAAQADITDGRLPTLDELYVGMGFAGGEWRTDCRLWCRDLILDGKLGDATDRFQHLHDACSEPALLDCWTAVEHGDLELLWRLDFYLAANGVPDARQRIVCRLLDSPYGRADHRQIAFGIAVARTQSALTQPPRLIESAQITIKAAAADIDLLAETKRVVEAGDEAPSAEDQLAERLMALDEDRAEIDPSVEPPQGLIVVPASPALKAAKGHRKDILAPYVGIVGATLPYIEAPDPVDAVDRFRARMPHAVAAFIQIFGHHQPGDPLHLGQWLLVGPPGTGKTTMIRTMAEILGMPVEIHGLAGASDSSIMGTSSQWSTARAHPVLQLINQHRVANPVVGWDEIEKVGTARHNGNALDALLPILEKHTARKHRDLALEVEVDLSMVSHIATANTLEGIPRPVLDRFRVIKMPEPGWQHVGVLSRNILNRIAEERGLRPEWFPDFQGDEMEVIERNWSGGSIRRLERIVRILVDGRDRLLGRA